MLPQHTLPVWSMATPPFHHSGRELRGDRRVLPFPRSPLPIHQETLSVLPSKQTQMPSTPHHPHRTHPSPGRLLSCLDDSHSLRTAPAPSHCILGASPCPSSHKALQRLPPPDLLQSGGGTSLPPPPCPPPPAPDFLCCSSACHSLCSSPTASLLFSLPPRLSPTSGWRLWLSPIPGAVTQTATGLHPSLRSLLGRRLSGRPTLAALP